MKAFKPTIVTEAIRYTRLQEEALATSNVRVSKTNFPVYPINGGASMVSLSNSNKPPLLPTPQKKPLNSPVPKENSRPFKYIPAEVRA